MSSGGSGMGQAKERGSFEERKAAALAAGRGKKRFGGLISPYRSAAELGINHGFMGALMHCLGRVRGAFGRWQW